MNANLKSKRLLEGIVWGVVAVFAHNMFANQVIVNNPGISFGLSLNILIIALCWVILGAYLIKSWNRGLLLVTIGGLSNLSDRIRFGYVRDYWKIPVFDLVNNLNDWLIAIGVLCFFLSLWLKKK